MGIASRVAVLGKRLRLTAQEISADCNESHFLAHAALVRMLRDDPDLDRPEAPVQALLSVLQAVVLERRAAVAQGHAQRQRMPIAVEVSL